MIAAVITLTLSGVFKLMFLTDADNSIVDSEFSLDVCDDSPCIVIESSGGASPAHGVARRNPDYNALLGLVLKRLAELGVRLTAVILDSKKVQNIPIPERTAELGRPYPIDLTSLDVDDFRKVLQRSISLMHRAPNATSAGNSQKRIRICLDQVVSPTQLLKQVVMPTISSETSTDHVPGLTETERLYIQKARVGQGQFRMMLLDAYKGTCPILGISQPELLVASHIKPWNACTNKERLDRNNGVLLSSLYDKLFDRGFISFNTDGTIRLSDLLSAEDRVKCGLERPISIQFSPATMSYIEYHRKYVFKRNA